jgi:hypothetical protein
MPKIVKDFEKPFKVQKFSYKSNYVSGDDKPVDIQARINKLRLRKAKNEKLLSFKQTRLRNINISLASLNGKGKNSVALTNERAIVQKEIDLANDKIKNITAKLRELGIS